MKKVIQIMLLLCLLLPLQLQLASAQSAEITQLVLDIEKLSQLKKILSDMKDGYTIVSKGYGTIKDLSKGNFNLHNAFLNGLLMVNPKLRNYRRVAAIIRDEELLVTEYKAAFGRLKSSGQLRPQELQYLGTIYSNLFDRSLQNIDALTMVLTDSKLRMSDDERLKMIDNLYDDMQNKLGFLRSFNQQADALVTQRAAAAKNVTDLQQLYNLHP